MTITPQPPSFALFHLTILSASMDCTGILLLGNTDSSSAARVKWVASTIVAPSVNTSVPLFLQAAATSALEWHMPACEHSVLNDLIGCTLSCWVIRDACEPYVIDQVLDIQLPPVRRADLLLNSKLCADKTFVRRLLENKTFVRCLLENKEFVQRLREA